MTFRVSLSLSALAIALLAASPAGAQGRAFHVPGGDGYGLSECLAEHGDCGQAVADAWCAANGFARAMDFGPVRNGEVTGSVANASAPPVGPGFIVQCDK